MSKRKPSPALQRRAEELARIVSAARKESVDFGDIVLIGAQSGGEDSESSFPWLPENERPPLLEE